MKLSDAGEGRIRGYLYLLQQSLRSFMPVEMAADAVREVESHIRERLAEDASSPETDERQHIESVLKSIGPPLDLARVYAAEMTLDEAVATGRTIPLLRSLALMAATTMGGFGIAVGYFALYLVGAACIIVAALKPIFPDNVGIMVRDGIPLAVGAVFTPQEGVEIVGGYELVPILLAIGVGVLILVHRSARKTISGLRDKLHAKRLESARTDSGR